jgi:hypothetical protein
MENASGQGKGSPVPAEVDRWNWGAFLLNWAWGIGNNTLIALLSFLPCAILVMPFVLGIHGSKWAWQNKRWESVEHFKAVQRKWAQAGVALLGFGVVILALLFFAITSAMKSSEVYQLAFARLEGSPEALLALGQPLKTGMVQGKMSTSGPSGSAQISFSVQGPKAAGKAYVDATKDMGKWTIERLELEVENRPQRLLLVGPARAPGASPQTP